MTNLKTPAETAQSAGDPLFIGGVELPNRVFLAPLSGISDVPFRRLARRLGAGLVVSEMVASAELVRGNSESALRAMRDGVGVHSAQLAGRDPYWMEQAAAHLRHLGADLIDINMGCPAKKVVGGQSGSALMRDLDLALRLIEATVRGAGSVPVTLKMRLGWDRASVNAPELARRAEAAGVRLLTVHGRTRDQFYDGAADWRAIAEVKATVSIPVVANGDLAEPGHATAMLEASQADAVMVGRGACGRPWLPGLVAGSLSLCELEGISFGELVIEHYEAMLSHYGNAVGVRHARKHLNWYLERFSAASGADMTRERVEILASAEASAVVRRLRDLFGSGSVAVLEGAAPAAALKQAA